MAEPLLCMRCTANIPEVMKTRLQLQGELLKSSDAPKVYKNVFDVFRKTWANEGLRGLQRGLGPAVSSRLVCAGCK
jgi:solute carrier family 25 protein 34/35